MEGKMKPQKFRVRYREKYGVTEEDLTRKEYEAVRLREGIKNFRILREVKNVGDSNATPK